MKIIKSMGDYIQVDPQHCQPGYVWGKRWNWNEGKWSSQCMLWRDGVEISESELLRLELHRRIAPLDIDK